MTRHALVIDDDLADRDLMRCALSSIGLAVITAGSVEEGVVEVLERRPDLVVSDLHLPDRTGFELCRLIKAHPELRCIPVLMVTGMYRREEARLQAQGLGADAYLLKPFHIRALLETARRLLGPD